MIQSFVNDVKAFFNRSWSIFIARAEIFAGFVLGVVGAIDWSGFANIDFDAGFTNNQVLWFSIGLVIKGIISEIGRRSGTVVSSRDQLIPVNIAEAKDIPVKK